MLPRHTNGVVTFGDNFCEKRREGEGHTQVFMRQSGKPVLYNRKHIFVGGYVLLSLRMLICEALPYQCRILGCFVIALVLRSYCQGDTRRRRGNEWFFAVGVNFLGGAYIPCVKLWTLQTLWVKGAFLVTRLNTTNTEKVSSTSTGRAPKFTLEHGGVFCSYKAASP